MSVRRGLVLFVFSGGMLMASSCGGAANVDLRQQIQDTFNRASGAFGVKARLSIDDGEAISSSAEEGVRFGLPAMQRALNDVAPDAQRSTVQFYVAHEVWHQRQYVTLGPTIMTQKTSEPRLYECQADLLAAEFVLQSTPNVFSGGAQAAEGVAGRAYAMGVPVHPGGSHPSPAQRRTSVLFGFTRALQQPPLLASYKAALNAPGEESEIVTYLNHLMDRDPEESDAEWSMKVCKRIIHYDERAVQAVSVGRAQVNFNKDPAAPFVAYAIPYRNIGKRPLRLDVVVQSVAVSRKDPHDVWKHQLIDVDTRSVDLAPDATYLLSGQLPWYGDKEDYYPALEFDPGSSRSLVAAEFSGPEAIQSSCLNYAPTGLNAFAKSLRGALVKFSGAAGGGFAELQTGASTDEGDSVSFSSLVAIPGATDTTVEREKSGAAQVSAELYRGTAAEEATQIYGRYRDALLMMCPPIGAHLEEESRHDLPDMTLSFSDSMEINMYIYKSKTSGKYSVNFVLKAVKW